MAKRSGGDSRIAPATAGSQPYLSARSVPNDQPTSQRSGSSANSAYSIAAATSNRSPTAAVERALAGAAHARRAPGVEAQHGQPGQRRQPPGRLAEDVAVHHAAVGGQRVQADQGGHRLAGRPGRASSPTRVRPSAVCSSMSSRRGGQDRVGTDEHAHLIASCAVTGRVAVAHRVSRSAGSRARQHAGVPVPAVGLGRPARRSGQATTCGTPGRIS